MTPNAVRSATDAAARIDVVGLGPAGPELITAEALDLMARAPAGVPAHRAATRRRPCVPGARTFDHHYESADTFDDVYRAIVDDLVAAAAGPSGAGRLCRPRIADGGRAHRGACCVTHPRVAAGEVTWSSIRRSPSSTWPSPGWAWTRWTPACGWSTRERFAVDAAGERGPLLVAQCWSRGGALGR